MSSGRSRGRARTRSEQQPVAPTPVPATTPVPPPTVPQPTVTQQLPTTTPRPQVLIEAGRGRGAEPVQPTPPQSSIATTATSNEESPPQQPSPPQKSSPPLPASLSLGRAALRGAPHQPGVTVRSELIGATERLTLQETGDVQARAERRPDRIETVPFTRPATCTEKTGVSGEKIKILCNYFEILSQPNWVLYQYHVDYAPPIDSKRMRIGLFKDHDKLFPTNKAFDGATLYSLTKLPNEVTEVASKRETDQAIITIKIKRVNEIVPTSPNFVHLFNLVFRRCLKLYGMQQIDRNYYDMNNKITIEGYNLDMINGFATSIANYENKLLLCAELTHKLLHKSTILDLMHKLFDDSRGNQGQFREMCIAQIVGKIIMTTYNNKTYKIDDIEWEKNPSMNFESSRGSVSFVDYYGQHYSIKIKDVRQPLLVSLPSARDRRRGQETPFLLVPELCIITGVDERMREDFRFKKAVERFSKVGPKERCARLSKFVSTFRNNEQVKGELEKWAMNFSSNPAELEGRIIQPETLGFGNDIKKQLNERADWSNEMKGTPLYRAIALNEWLVVYPGSKKHVANMFVNTYGDVIRSMGINAERPVDVAMHNDSPDTIVNTLKQVITDKVQMVVVLVTSKRKDRYDAIKRICCLEKPVPSQVITTQIVEDDKKRKSVVTKVAIQMNCKLGGEIWLTPIPIKSVMICGYDTYHDSQRKKSSVCAFIATSNEDKTRYFSRATIQETHQELSNNLTMTVKSACDHYMKMNNRYPEKLIIYRDGVSDGQLTLVLEHEIPQIKKAFSLIDPNYSPKMAFIVVKKRGNSRFFAKLGADLVNPPCGTVIDTVVTRAEWFDFYLISQNVNQGTVNPTHYNVIYETIGLKAEHYQRLSFKSTHMYYNWPGTIRVPATCQYAHKLAFLVGQSLHKEHDSSLCDKLFYL